MVVVVIIDSDALCDTGEVFTHFEIFREALFSSIADAEWSSFNRKQAEHLLLLKMFGANLRHSTAAMMMMTTTGRGHAEAQEAC